MHDLLNDHARRLLVLAQGEALGLSHDEIATEHLLLGALDRRIGSGAAALASLGVTHDRAHTEIVRIVGHGSGRGMARGRGRAGRARSLPLSLRAQWILERARREAAAIDHTSVGSEHILLALLREDGGHAFRVFERLRVNRDEAHRRVLVALDVLPYPGPTLLDGIAGNLDARIEQVRAAKDDALDRRDFGLAVEFRQVERNLVAQQAPSGETASRTA
ncbi:Clp protease N-terminal domain-containing protein [Pseudofrankia inefficax]|uniref:Clp domain protein n=1 Tax=Pseudofrankia inefficax (strain DSM 45817 / CECT 9037 / DDB 130130 / EuI1c) TaxID=298654 RepID=E3J5A5_PSEI1|nr:Clp protease N-terminal domain-containing protein [Pseudofrankia inefficax]ADP80703.1 Clp domain protein [Pseudofrankia inefficax]